MTTRIFTLIFCSLLLSFHFSWAQQAFSPGGEKPKVVIGVIVENMRPDYIQRYWNTFGENGFKKLFSQGAVCTNVNLTHYFQNYASGTATLYTGTTPSLHGIVGKTWYDRNKSKEVECTVDDYYFTVGADTKFGNASPKQLLSTTITDNLKIFTHGKSLVFSAALNRESAIFSAGHSADGAYWFDPESGRMISSSFYVSTFPGWVREFNNLKYFERYTNQNWVLLLPGNFYTESLPDNYPLEKGYFEKWNTFPHNIRKYVKAAENFSPLKSTPYGNELMKNFAIALLDNEPVGEDEYTDFVSFTFSSMDDKNNLFGPASLEMQDNYLYLDKYLAELIAHAENRFGKQNVLFFLTANTSASYPVDYLKEKFNLPVNYFYPENAMALLTSYLNVSYGEGKYIEHHSDCQVYLNHDLIKKSKLNLNDIREDAAGFINQFEGVQLSMPAHQLETGSSSNGLLSTLYKSYTKSRSGDFLYILKEGWQPTYKYHRVNYTDQSNIPLVFYGAGVRPQVITEKYNAIDLVPTLSDLLHIPRPDKSQGITITPVLNK
jgi:hypothetical protein